MQYIFFKNIVLFVFISSDALQIIQYSAHIPVQICWTV